MGQLLLTIAGTVAGGLIGGPFGAQIGAMVGGALGSALFGPTTQGPRLDDLTVTTSTYGNAIPRLFGTARMSTNLIWTGGIKEHKKKSGGLGKGGPKMVSYSYTASFAVAVCVGEIDGILRIWGDPKLIFGSSDSLAPPTAISPGETIEAFIQSLTGSKKKVKYKFRVYTGSETQLPDSIIEGILGVGNTPAYRGMAYIVFQDMPLEDFGNRIPAISVEVSKAKIKAVPSIPYYDTSGTLLDSVNAGYFDWEADRVVIQQDGYMKTYSLTTMKETGSFPIPAGNKLTGSPGTGPWVSQIGNSNHDPVATWDGATFSAVQQVGRTGSNLAEIPNQECEGPSPEWANFVANGYFGTFRAGGKYFFVNVNGFGSGSIWGFDFVYVRNIIRSGGFLAMAEQDKSSQFAMWGGDGSGGIYADVYTCSASAHCTQDTVGVPMSVCAGEIKYIVHPDETHCPVSSLSLVLPGRSMDTNLNVMYDSTDDTIAITGRDNTTGKNFFGKFLAQSGECVGNFELPSGSPPPQMSQSRLAGGTFGYPFNGGGTIGATGFVYFDMNAGTYTFTPYDVFNFGSFAVWDSYSDSVFANWLGSGNHSRRIFNTSAAGTVTVGSICAEIIEETGLLGPGDYDVSTLTDEVTGYTIGRDATARDCLQQISTAFFFDGVESDFKLKMIKRGGGSAVTITEDEMGNVSERDTQLNETLAQEVEAPMRVTISYMDKSRDYQTGTQFAKRLTNPNPTMNSRKEDKFDLPIVMTATQCKQIADKQLKMSWNSRVSGDSVLPWKFLKYDPCDVLTINLNDGSSRTTRITRMDMGVDMTLKVSSVNENAIAYISNVVADPGRGVPSRSAFDPGKPFLHVLNTPLLRDVDDTQGVGSKLYLSASVPAGKFGGAYLMKALPGSDFVDDGYVSQRPTSGLMLTVLPTTNMWGSTDTTTELRVKLYNDDETLESISYDELVAGKNIAVIGNEVIQFQNATLGVDGIWTLSTLLRARRGTDYAVGSHKAGELFILLAEDGSIQYDVRSQLDFGFQELLKAIAPGTLPDATIGTTYTLNPSDLRPYAPSDFVVTDDGTDITVNFKHRSRIAFGLPDGIAEAPYREGPPTSAFYRYKLWADRDPSEKPWEIESVIVPAYGTTPVTDTDSTIKTAPSFTFPIASMEKFLLLAAEVGFVEGFYRYLSCVKADDGTWNVTELYP